VLSIKNFKLIDIDILCLFIFTNIFWWNKLVNIFVCALFTLLLTIMLAFINMLNSYPLVYFSHVKFLWTTWPN
jgi:hypothetical protein